METGKTGRYLKYALGEIFLVVIGILIALQINNWNEGRKSSIREKMLLIELRTNLHTNVQNLNADINKQVKSAKIIHFLLNHLDNQKPYFDSLDFYFAEADFAPDVVLTSSAFETLKSSGLELIRRDNLRKELVYLFEVTYPTLMQETKRLEDLIWPTASVPMYQKHFRREFKNKAIAIDYRALLADKELTNMLSFRVALREASTEVKSNAIVQTTQLISLIEEELIKRKATW